MKKRLSLRRVHIWLGWVIGLPLLFWIVTGLVMVSRPIETVRGEHLILDAPTLPPSAALAVPRIGLRPVRSMQLEQRTQGPVWIIRYADGGSRRADGFTGHLLPELSAAEAAGVVRSRYAGDAAIAATVRTSADHPPLELRRKIAAWQVAMTDGTHIYVDAATGEIVARRTPFWRVYDLMWGLHIMDLGTREDSNNPLVIGLASLSLASTLLAILLLPMSVRRGRRG